MFINSNDYRAFCAAINNDKFAKNQKMAKQKSSDPRRADFEE